MRSGHSEARGNTSRISPQAELAGALDQRHARETGVDQAPHQVLDIQVRALQQLEPVALEGRGIGNRLEQREHAGDEQPGAALGRTRDLLRHLQALAQRVGIDVGGLARAAVRTGAKQRGAGRELLQILDESLGFGLRRHHREPRTLNAQREGREAQGLRRAPQAARRDAAPLLQRERQGLDLRCVLRQLRIDERAGALGLLNDFGHRLVSCFRSSYSN